MSNRHTYSYEGPLPLGSVVAHHCGAAGLVTAKDAHWQLVGREIHKSAYIEGLAHESLGHEGLARENLGHEGLENEALGHEGLGQYILEVYEVQNEESISKERLLRATIRGEISSSGRTHMGGQLLRLLRTAQGLAPVGEWGTMVGVRPTKLFHKLWDQAVQDERSSVLPIRAASLAPMEEAQRAGQQNFSEANAVMTNLAQKASEALRELHEVSESKLSLLRQIGTLQRPYVEPKEHMKSHISVYAGIPFCQTRCTYCSFPYGLIQDYERIPEFVRAFRADAAHLEHIVKRFNLTVDSLYMGGGTPTSLDDEEFAHVLAALQPLHQERREFTVEAGRPDSVTKSKLDTMKRCGVTRISINPQSMQDSVLKAIARGHTAADIRQLYKVVKQSTDFIVNMDFIAGLPHQTLAYMEENLDYVCQARPENVTIHTLALKRGSPLYEGHGLEAMPEEAVVKEMVNLSRARLEAAGYVPYYVYRQQYMRGQLENIGYTLPGYECEYNIRIMEERQSILSIGPGSSSKWISGTDYRQKKQHVPKDVSVYIDTLHTLLQKRETLSNTHWEG